jgi:hypothetical protein
VSETADIVVVPGSAGIAVGIIGLCAATLASAAAFHRYWLLIWVVAAAAAACAGACSLAGSASVWRGQLRNTAVWKVFEHLLPSLFAGAVLTAVLWHAGVSRVVPGVWLLLYGCGLLYLSAVASRGIALLGALFAALAVLAFGLPESRQAVLLGVGFGELHILYGVVALRWPGAYQG